MEGRPSKDKVTYEKWPACARAAIDHAVVKWAESHSYPGQDKHFAFKYLIDIFWRENKEEKDFLFIR